MASTTYPEGPRHAIVTPDDHGAVLQVVAWYLMVVMILTTSLRLFIRFTTAHVPGRDDVVVFVATLFGISQTVAISVAVNNGLGKRLANLNSAQILGLQKDVYVSTILYLLTLFLAKASLLLLIARLIALKFHLILVRALGAVILLWTISSVFAVAFQCDLPHPWDYLGGKCFDSLAFWDIIGAFDILTDVMLIALPTRVVWDLKMNYRRKMVVVSAFAFRLIVIAATIARLVFLKKFHGSTDPTYDSLAYHIATQCQLTLSVIVACIPALKPYMDRAESGLLTVSINKRGYGGTYGNPNSYHMQSMSNPNYKISKNSKHSENSNKSKSLPSQNNDSYSRATGFSAANQFRPDHAEHHVVVSAPGRQDSDDAHRDDRPSMDGAGSDKMIIQKSTDWDVRYEDDAEHQLTPHHPEEHHPEGLSDPSHDNVSPDITHARFSV